MKKKRVILTSLLVGVLVVGVLIGQIVCNAAEAQEKMRLRFAHPAEETHPAHLAAKLFKYMVEERTEGRIRIDIYPANMLGSPPEFTEQVKLGVTDMSLSTSGQLQLWVPEYAVVMLPFVFNGYEHAHRVMDGPAGDYMAELAAKEGFVIVSNWEWGFRQITNNKRAIHGPDDLRGMKMRVPPEMQLQAMFETLGSVVTEVAFPELYMALSQGLVNGQCNPLPTIYHHKFYEVQKYLALTNHVYNNEIHVVSAKTWEKLSEDDRVVIEQASKLAGAYMRQLVMEGEEKLIEKLKEKGMIVTQPDPEPFRKLMDPAYERIAEFAGKASTERFLQFAEEAREK